MAAKVLDQVREYQEQIERAKAPNAAGAARTIAMTAGHRVMMVDMGTSLGNLVPVVVDAEGYSITVAKGGSDRIALMMDLGAAGQFGPVYPGMTIRPKTKFSRIRLRKWFSTTVPATSALTDGGCYTLGRYVTLAIGKTLEAQYEDPSTDVAGFMWQRTSAGVQAYNSLLNVPTAAADGISVRGARAVKVGVEDVNGTVTGGTIVWWFEGSNGVGSAQWGETEVQQVLVTGRQFVWCSELEVKLSAGRLFPELRSYTNSAAGTAPNLYIQCFGEGGELRAGDVSL